MKLLKGDKFRVLDMHNTEVWIFSVMDINDGVVKCDWLNETTKQVYNGHTQPHDALCKILVKHERYHATRLNVILPEELFSI